MRKHICIMTAIIAVSGTAWAQSLEDLSLRVGYFGDFATHPGVLVGVEYPLFKLGPFAFPVAFEARGFVHPSNSTVLTGSGTIGCRFEGKSGFEAGLSIGVGYRHTLTAAPTFAWAAGGGVEQIADPGMSTAYAHLALTAGSRIGAGPLGSWFIGPEAGIEFPWYGSILPRFAIAGGVTLTPWRTK